MPLGLRENWGMVNDVVVGRVVVVVGKGYEYEHEFALPLFNRLLLTLFLEVYHDIALVIGNVWVPKGQR